MRAQRGGQAVSVAAAVTVDHEHTAAGEQRNQRAEQRQRAFERLGIGRILEDEIAKGSFRAVLHCYTGGRELAMKAIGLGLSISFTGILTFKKSEALRELAAELPGDRIMVETDSPYLAPGKFRGKRNEPSYVVEVAKVLAETRGVSLEEISRQTTENFFRLFSKVPAPKAVA